MEKDFSMRVFTFALVWAKVVMRKVVVVGDCDRNVKGLTPRYPGRPDFTNFVQDNRVSGTIGQVSV